MTCSATSHFKKAVQTKFSIMKLSKKLVLIVLAIVVAAAAIVFLATKDSNEGSKIMSNGTKSTNGLQIVSPAFKEGAAIPVQYTCKGQNVSPPLNIMNVPAGVKSLALIMYDPDAPVGDFVHWTMWDIPPNIETISANSVPVGAVQGVTSFGDKKYGGPCPPSGTHRYMFELYALDTSLNLPADTTRDGLKKSMEGHIIEQHTLMGKFSSEQTQNAV